ncbi:P-loop containing nucleoside triphosphate hydrolase protein [Fistulina hepatica ATCC 64428]|uniref:p-loop containing nucleoside triphosphate hydrolase protein n=1 Tax=Fistulina hepatica ATCC 64428 TaxID=1128425 RepID=A0A0D7AN53_9AGAR|nr:P-loop containing nucleoside triphosphate hydrolase protein [Fistulina hepatica ATCC 64428]
MQLDSATTKSTGLSSSESAAARLKRSFSHSSIARASAATRKVPRIDKDTTMPPPPRGNRPHQSSSSSSSRIRGSSRGGDHFHQQFRGSTSRHKQRVPPVPTFSGPFYNKAYILEHDRVIELKKGHEKNCKGVVKNYFPTVQINVTKGLHDSRGNDMIHRATVNIETDPQIIAHGDAPQKSEAVELACLSALYKAHAINQLYSVIEDQTSIDLPDGSVVPIERAQAFMDYYCRKFGFSRPDFDYISGSKRGLQYWEAVLVVGDRRIGFGSGSTKKAAERASFLDVVKYFYDCDADLWKAFVEAARTGADLGLAPTVSLVSSPSLNRDVRDITLDIRKSNLYHNRPKGHATAVEGESGSSTAKPSSRLPQDIRFEHKSKLLSERRQAYLIDPTHEKMRSTRASLPVFTRADDIIRHIEENDVTILVAATGSGKTTQIPQLILDHFIDQDKGSKCNIICTQPRRLAAISVAHRVAKERGENLGQSVGYTVRFESTPPEDHGSVTFCTIGVFLKKMQSALHEDANWLDGVTHILVDEVHERDVDTDLLLVVIKKLLADRKLAHQQIKIILMSATIDPTLFQTYFADAQGEPVKVIDIPGRSFPVKKYFLEDYVQDLAKRDKRWIFADETVARYVTRELDPSLASSLGVMPRSSSSSTIKDSDMDIPVPLVAAAVEYVMKRSEDGHVLVFLPGWDDISAVQKCLAAPRDGSWNINFNDPNKISIHVLHSSVPLAEQQRVFEPAAPGVRRIILSTNIAETSVTIPDVVYVVDTGRVKETQYNPDRHTTALVNAWVGKSNLNQRAGRAGRHRPGEYFGILSKEHYERLHSHQTVEINRTDLSNVVMHVKALNFSGMSVQEVLASAIEAPPAERVEAAMHDLQTVGALDEQQNLTMLGRVLLQIPIDTSIGRLVLYGSLFRCLDSALTLASIMGNREPFVAPMHLKTEARSAKEKFTNADYRSDVLAAMNAYNEWWKMQGANRFVEANRFCSENFLSKPTLLLIQKLKGHLYESISRAGIVDVSAGGIVTRSRRFGRQGTVPPELNVNGDSLPLLSALISLSAHPKFAVRSGEHTLRTPQDKVAIIHPSSVNSRKHTGLKLYDHEPRSILAFLEKRQNATAGSSQTTLVTTTSVDPAAYVLFGAHDVRFNRRGLVCDNWLPLNGDVDGLEELARLREFFLASMQRVYEGILLSRRQMAKTLVVSARAESDDIDEEDEAKEDESDDDDVGDSSEYVLAQAEKNELDFMTRDIVRLLSGFAEERIRISSPRTSVPGSPYGSPSMGTPWGSPYNSAPGTPLSSRRGLPPAMGPTSTYLWPNGVRRISSTSSRGSNNDSWRSTNPPNSGSNSAYDSRPGTPSRLSQQIL